MHVTRPVWWSVSIFVLSCLYLLPETIFNAQLVGVAGGEDSSIADLRSVELFGRAISGIGVLLLLSDWLINGKRATSKAKIISLFLLLAVVVWPTVFFGQKWVIDQWLVNPSTPQQRQDAYLAQVLRGALITNAVEIEGIHYDPDRHHTPAEQTFLAVFGGLAYADRQLLDSVKEQREAIISRYVRKSAYENFDAHYQDYKDLRTDLRDSFAQYQQSVINYQEGLDSAPERSRKHWKEVQGEIKNGWDRYQKEVGKFDQRTATKGKQIAPKIYDYWQRHQSCVQRSTQSSRQQCLKRINDAYDKRIGQAGIGRVKPEYWLVEEKISTSENVTNTLLTGILSGGASLVLQGLSKATGGDGGWKDVRYKYTDDADHYTLKIRQKLAPKFEKESGYPYGIKQFQTFKAHAATARKVTKSLKGKGVRVPANWNTGDRKGFNRAITVRVKEEAEATWQRETKKQGLSIRPYQTWEQFQRNQSIQNRIKREMGEFYVKPVLATWNNKAFLSQVIEPNIRRKTKEILHYLKQQEKEFADGGGLEMKGKQALRASLIPPLSMAISLFLVILTLLKLPGKGIALVAQIKGQKQPVKGQGTKRIPLVPVATYLSLLLVMVIPVTAMGNRYTQQDSAVNVLLKHVQESGYQMTSLALRWALNIQPLVKPAGDYLENTLSIAKAFKSIEPSFEELDQSVFEDSRGDGAPKQQGNTKEAEKASYVTLTVVTQPIKARVQVMNIKPRYKAGMKLPVGLYDIRVSAPGYETYRSWSKLSSKENRLEVTLNAKP